MPNALYKSFNQEKSSQREYPSYVEYPIVSYSFWADNPTTTWHVGDRILWRNCLSKEISSNYVKTSEDTEQTDSVFVITQIRVTDEVFGERHGYPFRQWQFTFDGYLIAPSADTTQSEVITSKYSVNVDKLENGDTLFKISINTVNFGEEPIIKFTIGEEQITSGENIDIPGVPAPFICTNYSYSDAFNDLNIHVWTITYEGFALVQHDTYMDTLDEVSVSYEINGTTAATVDGDFIALRRSEEPIMKKSITKYTDSQASITTPGNIYQGGIVLSESIVKETITTNNVITQALYKHTIEIQGIGFDNSSECEADDT